MGRLTGAILGAAALGLAGCAGFTPMYAQPGVVAGLERIAVEVPDTRTGFLLRERLEDAFGQNRSAQPVYRLVTRVRETRSPLGRRADDTATRYALTLTVAYDLVEIPGNRRVYRDVVTVSTTYAASVQPYAGVVSSQDGSERAVAQAADLIRRDLAQVLAERGATGPVGG